MQRKEINILRKTAHQVGFIYKTTKYLFDIYPSNENTATECPMHW